MNYQLTPEQMEIYRAGARRRRQQEQEKMVKKQQSGWKVAKEAAELLKREFGAQKVVIFGSMLKLDKLHDRSDLDLAVWGLNPRDYYRAVGKLLSLDPDIPVDLVEVESAKPHILKVIEEEGVTW
ncbi:MAG: nucleotidyltransferase domain-containing protein [Oscillatoria sp. PMC 1051.18]|nr:nucleotidyltransferase domain-containing protein [Oscillatoria sp. PMC 1050.18]MEC5032772.1 nucleotidyltransferase domain-containing protein [Oscillatoria sp. PMC 1051.18]